MDWPENERFFLFLFCFLEHMCLWNHRTESYRNRLLRQSLLETLSSILSDNEPVPFTGNTHAVQCLLLLMGEKYFIYLIRLCQSKQKNKQNNNIRTTDGGVIKLIGLRFYRLQSNCDLDEVIAQKNSSFFFLNLFHVFRLKDS